MDFKKFCFLQSINFQFHTRVAAVFIDFKRIILPSENGGIYRGLYTLAKNFEIRVSIKLAKSLIFQFFFFEIIFHISFFIPHQTDM